LDFRGHFKVGEREGKWTARRGKGKEGKRWVKNTPDGDGVCGW